MLEFVNSMFPSFIRNCHTQAEGVAGQLYKLNPVHNFIGGGGQRTTGMDSDTIFDRNLRAQKGLFKSERSGLPRTR